MTKAASTQATAAQAILAHRLHRARPDVHYTAAFDTQSGRRLIINRQIQFIGIFVEMYPGDGRIEGVSMNCQRSKGHYSPMTPRAASIMSDERLGIGKEMFYLRCETLQALERFVIWYEQQ